MFILRTRFFMQSKEGLNANKDGKLPRLHVPEPTPTIRTVMGLAFVLLFVLLAVKEKALNPLYNNPFNIEGPLCDGSAKVVTADDMQFLHELQASLNNHNYKWLAEHVDFPLKLVLPFHKSLVVSNKASLKEHFDDIFPPANVKSVLALQKDGLRRTIQGVELGKTGVYCLPVPEPVGIADPLSAKYFIYHVKSSAPPESAVEPTYAITWTDKVFFIQIKEALRHHKAAWMAAHTEVPFFLDKYKKDTAVSRSWLKAHFEETWFHPISRLCSKEERSYYRAKDLRKSIAQMVLNSRAEDLWQNDEGVMADDGTIWFGSSPGYGGRCSNYAIIAVHPLGSSDNGKWYRSG